MSATVQAYEVHPLAHLMPAMLDSEYEELREDIAANGLREAITLYEDKILDGRHRYRACEDTGVRPTFQTYDGDAPATYVLSLNVKRRQLTQSQKAMLATDFLPHLKREAQQRQDERLRSGPRDAKGYLAPLAESEDSARANPGRSAQQAAEQLGVGHAQVVRANRVKRDDPELAEQVRQGEVTVSSAYEQVTRQSDAAEKSTTRDGSRRRPAMDLVERVVGMVDALPAAIEHIDVQSAVASPDAPLADWDKRLTKTITALAQLRKQIRGANS